jgi:cholesterol oxidase
VSERHDVVVIGSGFGGSVVAHRMSAAGHGVLVLERGRRWPPPSFPRDVTDTDRLLWRHPERGGRGLFDVRFLSGLATITAAGVGGGSLVYAGIHYRPRPSVFRDPRWPSSLDADTLEPYYERVAEALAPAPVPASIGLPKRDAFHRASSTLGLRSEDPPLAVRWSEPPVPDGRAACQLCAACEYGCTHGAKTTLEFCYLGWAEAAGATVRTGCVARAIAPAPGGGWEVRLHDLDRGVDEVVVGRRVVLSAGTLGTNEILLRSRDEARTLPRLSHRLGHGYSGNGDFLGNIQNIASPIEPWRGPDVTSIQWHDDDDALSFVLAAPTFSRPVMEVLASHGQPPGRSLGPLGPPLWRRLPGLLTKGLRSGVLARPVARPFAGAGPADRMSTVFAIGRDNAGGRVVLRNGEVDVVWDYARENRALIARQRAAMQELARAWGGTYGDFPTWGPFGKTMTVHNLGGCAVSDRADHGVVDPDGQVHGHPGLYVADGSIVPTSIGSHPVMTITALAERVAERMARTQPP